MSSRSISPDSANGTVPPMTVSAHLHAAVDQCIDALCFTGNHTLDSDLRAQPKASQASLDRLIQEQHRRVEENFGPQTGSAEALANILDELFRIDSASITENPNEPGQLTSPVVEIMTDTTAKIFKKEMKQRIHEWEGAFRQQFGKDPTPQDKNRLKHIYELYKVVKNRVLKGAPTTTTSSEQQPQPSVGGATATSSASTSQPRPSSGGVAVNTPVRSSTPTTGSANQQQHQASPSMTPAAAFGNNQQQQNSNNNLGTNVQLTPMGQTPMNNNNNTSSRPSSNPGSRAPTPVHHQQDGSAVVPGSSSSSNTNNATSSSSQQQLTIPPTTKAQFDLLVQQKKQLKRELHAFEGDFTNRHGRAPGRDDRLPLIDKYQRYGELKIAIQNWQKEHGGSDE